MWGHALLLVGRACLLEPAAGLSRRPLLQQSILVPADRCCPHLFRLGWPCVWCQALRLDLM